MHHTGRPEKLTETKQIEGDATNKIKHKSAPEFLESAIPYHQKIIKLAFNDPLTLNPTLNEKSEKTEKAFWHQGVSQDVAKRN